VFVFGVFAIGSAAFIVTACEDDPATTPAGPDATPITIDSSITPPSSNDGQVPVDAGNEAGEEIADGGGTLPEEDGGLTDPDGGFDAGPACATLTTGAFVDSTCQIRIPIMGGGVLTTTNYQLVGVAVLGARTFCADRDGGFQGLQHRGALEVTAATANTATFEFVDQYRRTQLTRPSTRRYDVAVTAAGNGLVFTAQPCAAQTPPTTATYTVGVVPGSLKKTITLRLPYGSGFALYQYAEP